MCGILGVVNFKPERLEYARRALATLAHRGPDQHGEWYDGHIYLGHQRLSILDLSENAVQPLTDARAEIVVAVNGEIYNYYELKALLDQKHFFKSKSDSELFVHGYKEWGIDGLLEKLDGMFAFLIYDQRTETVYLGRDRYGKKPLFYTRVNDEWMIASEIKAIFAYFPETRTFSKAGVEEWIQFRGSRSGNTIYHNIVKLQPGHYIKLSKGREDKKCYYDLLDHIQIQNPLKKSDEYLEDLNCLLSQAVKKRLLSDVPVGLQLSGGVDSSLIAYYLRKCHPGEIHTYSIGFNNENAEFSEERYASHVAEKLGLIHHQINIGHDEILENFEDALYLFDGMLDIPNGIAIYLLSKKCKETITVALTGEGADELFGGYSKNVTIFKLLNEGATHIPQRVIDCLGKMGSARLNSLARKLYLNKKYYNDFPKLLEYCNSYLSQDTAKLLFANMNSSIFNGLNKDKILALQQIKAVLMMDHLTYLTFLLDRQDRASMGAGVESRLPFVDKSLVEWGINLPESLLFNGNETKILLKKLCSRFFGAEFSYRNKMGFPLPIEKWLNADSALKPYVDNIFDGKFILKDSISMNHAKSLFKEKSFANKLICYGDSEVMWIKWFLMVLRKSQDLFKISDIR